MYYKNETKKHLGKRWMAALLSLVLCLNMFSVTAFAAEKTTWDDVEKALDEIADESGKINNEGGFVDKASKAGGSDGTLEDIISNVNDYVDEAIPETPDSLDVPVEGTVDEKQAAEYAGTINDLSDKNAEVEEKFDEVDDKINGEDGAYDIIGDVTGEAKDAKDAKDAAVGELKDSTNSALDQKSAELDQALEELPDIPEEVAEQVAENEAKVKEAFEAADDLAKNPDLSEEEREQKKADIEQQAEELEEAVKESAGQVADARKAYDDAAKKVKDLQAELEGILNGVQSKLDGIYDDLNSKLAALREELEAAKTACDDAEAALAAAKLAHENAAKSEKAVRDILAAIQAGADADTEKGDYLKSLQDKLDELRQAIKDEALLDNAEAAHELARQANNAAMAALRKVVPNATVTNIPRATKEYEEYLRKLADARDNLDMHLDDLETMLGIVLGAGEDPLEALKAYIEECEALPDDVDDITKKDKMAGYEIAKAILEEAEEYANLQKITQLYKEFLDTDETLRNWGKMADDPNSFRGTSQKAYEELRELLGDSESREGLLERLSQALSDAATAEKATRDAAEKSGKDFDPDTFDPAKYLEDLLADYMSEEDYNGAVQDAQNKVDEAREAYENAKKALEALEANDNIVDADREAKLRQQLKDATTDLEEKENELKELETSQKKVEDKLEELKNILNPPQPDPEPKPGTKPVTKPETKPEPETKPGTTTPRPTTSAGYSSGYSSGSDDDYYYYSPVGAAAPVGDDAPVAAAPAVPAPVATPAVTVPVAAGSETAGSEEIAPEIEIADEQVPLAAGPVVEPASGRNISIPLMICFTLLPLMLLLILLLVMRKKSTDDEE